MEKAFVAQRVSTKLQATEKSIETAMTEAAELLATLIEARRELNISTVVGDKELANLTQALAALETARHATVEMHGGLGRLAKAMRIPVKNELTKPPSVTEGEQMSLRVAS
jgi:hypothetical protein